MRSKVAASSGRCSARWARAPDQRDTTTARQIQGTGLCAGPRKLGAELVGEHRPAFVQAAPRALANTAQLGRVALRAPTFGKIR